MAPRKGIGGPDDGIAHFSSKKQPLKTKEAQINEILTGIADAVLANIGDEQTFIALQSFLGKRKINREDIIEILGDKGILALTILSLQTNQLAREALRLASMAKSRIDLDHAQF